MVTTSPWKVRGSEYQRLTLVYNVHTATAAVVPVCTNCLFRLVFRTCLSGSPANRKTNLTTDCCDVKIWNFYIFLLLLMEIFFSAGKFVFWHRRFLIRKDISLFCHQGECTHAVIRMVNVLVCVVEIQFFVCFGDTMWSDWFNFVSHSHVWCDWNFWVVWFSKGLLFFVVSSSVQFCIFGSLFRFNWVKKVIYWPHKNFCLHFSYEETAFEARLLTKKLLCQLQVAV